MSRKIIIVISILVLFISAMIYITTYTGSHIDVSDVRYTYTGKAIAIYMNIRNTGLYTQCIIDVEVIKPKELTASIHRTIEKNGVVSMEHVDKLCIDPFGSVELRPGGLHIMIMASDHDDVNKIISKDGNLLIRLIMESGESIDLEVPLR